MQQKPSLIHLKSVTKFTTAHTLASPIFENASVTLPCDQHCALVGSGGTERNMALRLLGGKERPDSGIILTNAKFSIITNAGSYFHPKLTGLENIHLMARRYGITPKLLTEAALSLPVSTADWMIAARKLPMKTRRTMELLLAALLPFDCYLMEDIGRVEEDTLNVLFRILASRRAGIIFTTQNPKFVRQFSTCASVIHNRTISAYGSVEEALNNYAG